MHSFAFQQRLFENYIQQKGIFNLYPLSFKGGVDSKDKLLFMCLENNNE